MSYELKQMSETMKANCQTGCISIERIRDCRAPDPLPEIPVTDGQEVSMGFITLLGQWTYRNHRDIKNNANQIAEMQSAIVELREVLDMCNSFKLNELVKAQIKKALENIKKWSE